METELIEGENQLKQDILCRLNLNWIRNTTQYKKQKRQPHQRSCRFFELENSLPNSNNRCSISIVVENFINANQFHIFN